MSEPEPAGVEWNLIGQHVRATRACLDAYATLKRDFEAGKISEARVRAFIAEFRELDAKLSTARARYQARPVRSTRRAFESALVALQRCFGRVRVS